MPLLPLAGLALGLIFGSFIANLVIRWPQGRSVMTGRSACDACHKTLGPRELVPLLSHLLQRGRCRSCGAAIDPRHLMIELAAGLIGASALFVSPDLNGLAGAVFGWFLITLAVLDVEHFWLPDALTLPLMALGLIAAALLRPDLAEMRMIGALAGYAGLSLVGRAYRKLRGRIGLGGGDPKLLGAIGAWLGWPLLPFVLLLASLVGLGALLLRRERVQAATKVPLGALMAVAAWPLWLAGQGGLNFWS